MSPIAIKCSNRKKTTTGWFIHRFPRLFLFDLYNSNVKKHFSFTFYFSQSCTPQHLTLITWHRQIFMALLAFSDKLTFVLAAIINVWLFDLFHWWSILFGDFHDNKTTFFSASAFRLTLVCEINLRWFDKHQGSNYVINFKWPFWSSINCVDFKRIEQTPFYIHRKFVFQFQAYFAHFTASTCYLFNLN